MLVMHNTTYKKFSDIGVKKSTIYNAIRSAGGEIDAGKTYTFWGLEPEFQSVAVVGLGEKTKPHDDIENINQDKEAVRVAAAAGCHTIGYFGVNNICVESLCDPESAAEGSTLATWRFQEFKTVKRPLPKIELFCPENDDCKHWERGVIKADAQNIARCLSDTPANHMTPTIFAEYTEKLMGPLEVDVEIHDQEWAEKENMNAFLAVSQGSCEPPKFVELNYSNAEGDPYVLAGKGITFDSGGISIKPSRGMDDMRADMAGAAVCVATIYALATLEVKTNVKVLIPLVENLPSGSAIKPGDVIKARNGKTICIDNTDAEGRLILADALSYSSNFKPKWLMDIATLTGAMQVSLGNSATGVFTNSNKLYELLQKAGCITGDRVWRLPLWNHFTKQMTEHDGYDINNLAKGAKGGGSCTAAAFLKEFIPEKTEWLHLDIAGVMGPGDQTPYLGKGMTGRPTRTLIEFLESQSDGCC